MKKYFLFLIPIFSFVFSCSSLAMTPDEWLSSVDLYNVSVYGDDFYYDIHPVVSTFDISSGSSLDYSVDESLSLSSINWKSYRSGSLIGESGGAFGYIMEVSYNCNLIYTFENSTSTLFSNPGTLNLHIQGRGNSGNITAYYRDGNIISYPLSLSSTSLNVFEVSIDNDNADLYKVVLTVNPTNNSNYNTYGGFTKYGYIYPIVEEPEPEPEPDLTVLGDTTGVFTFLFEFMSDYIASLFLLEIVSGVTFGYFLIGCAILGIVFSFFYSKLIK